MAVVGALGEIAFWRERERDLAFWLEREAIEDPYIIVLGHCTAPAGWWKGPGTAPIRATEMRDSRLNSGCVPWM